MNPQKRWNEHVAGKKAASGWCRKHPPLKPMNDHFQFWEIPYITKFQVEEMEDVHAVALIKKYGHDKVRGGYRVQPNLSKELKPMHLAGWIFRNKMREF